MIKAKRLKKKLTKSDLDPGLVMAANANTLDYDFSVNFDKFRNFFDSVKTQKDLKPADYDFEFSKILYDSLVNSGATDAEFYDMRFWQWVSLDQLFEYCVWRWNIDINDVKSSHYAKVLGGGGVGGFSLNSISRLFIPAKILLKESDGDALLKSFFNIQQKEQSISQSTLAINSSVFISIVKATENLNTNQTVRAISRLNARKSGMCIDAMTSEEIADLALENI